MGNEHTTLFGNRDKIMEQLTQSEQAKKGTFQEELLKQKQLYFTQGYAPSRIGTVKKHSINSVEQIQPKIIQQQVPLKSQIQQPSEIRQTVEYVPISQNNLLQQNSQVMQSQLNQQSYTQRKLSTSLQPTQQFESFRRHSVDLGNPQPLFQQQAHIQQPLHAQQQVLQSQQQPLYAQQALNVQQQLLHAQQKTIHAQEQPLYPQQQTLHIQEQPLHVQQQTLHVSQPYHIQQPLHTKQISGIENIQQHVEQPPQIVVTPPPNSLHPQPPHLQNQVPGSIIQQQVPSQIAIAPIQEYQISQNHPQQQIVNQQEILPENVLQFQQYNIKQEKHHKHKKDKKDKKKHKHKHKHKKEKKLISEIEEQQMPVYASNQDISDNLSKQIQVKTADSQVIYDNQQPIQSQAIPTFGYTTNQNSSTELQNQILKNKSIEDYIKNERQYLEFLENRVQQEKNQKTEKFQSCANIDKSQTTPDKYMDFKNSHYQEFLASQLYREQQVSQKQLEQQQQYQTTTYYNPKEETQDLAKFENKLTFQEMQNQSKQIQQSNYNNTQKFSMQQSSKNRITMEENISDDDLEKRVYEAINRSQQLTNFIMKSNYNMK